MIKLSDLVNGIIVFRVQKSFIVCISSIIWLHGLNQDELANLFGLSSDQGHRLILWVART